MPPSPHLAETVKQANYICEQEEAACAVCNTRSPSISHFAAASVKGGLSRHSIRDFDVIESRCPICIYRWIGNSCINKYQISTGFR